MADRDREAGVTEADAMIVRVVTARDLPGHAFHRCL